MSQLNRMIFVTGFARGGTSWLRTCVAAHPQVQMIPRELPIFREVQEDRAALERAVATAIAEAELSGPWFVSKAPANAPYVGTIARIAPEAKFLFIIRDPRDVLISHKRGNQEWMKGRNSTVEGCMTKIAHYLDGYRVAAALPNVHLVRYEDLHQDFHATMARILEFLTLPFDRDLLDRIFAACNFAAMNARSTEDRDSPSRKGAIGDWSLHLEREDADWYAAHPTWPSFMAEHGYGWEPITYVGVLGAMRAANLASLDLDAMLDARLDPDRGNLVLLHDIDLLKTEASRDGVRTIARIEGELGLAGVFNFLPLDDVRYRPLEAEAVIRIIREIQGLAPRSSIGLHLNAAERFFPPNAGAAGPDHPDMPKAIAYLHEQVDAYERHGIRFRFATAHGYGRTTAVHPNNTTPVFREELAKRGIRLYDGDVREGLSRAASRSGTRDWGIRDVGGLLGIWDAPNNGSPIWSETYRRLPPGSLVTFLMHPGNYDINRAMCLGNRTNTPDRLDLGRMPVSVRSAPARNPGPLAGRLHRWLDTLRRLTGVRG